MLYCQWLHSFVMLSCYNLHTVMFTVVLYVLKLYCISVFFVSKDNNIVNKMGFKSLIDILRHCQFSRKSFWEFMWIFLEHILDYVFVWVPSSFTLNFLSRLSFNSYDRDVFACQSTMSWHAVLRLPFPKEIVTHCHLNKYLKVMVYISMMNILTILFSLIHLYHLYQILRDHQR